MKKSKHRFTKKVRYQKRTITLDSFVNQMIRDAAVFYQVPEHILMGKSYE